MINLKNNWYKNLLTQGVSEMLPFDESLLPSFKSYFEKEQLEILLKYHSDINCSFNFQVRNRVFIDKNKKITGSDFGFIELCNPDMLPIESKYFINSEHIKSYLKSLGINIRPNYISYYIYNNINLPRRLHHDTSYNSYKIFVALSDIKDISYGPYVFVRKSHRNILYKISDLISYLGIKKTGGDAYDAAWIDWKNLFIPYLKRGEAIVTNQKGIHGDLPCSSLRSKILLAICFNDHDIDTQLKKNLQKRNY